MPGYTMTTALLQLAMLPLVQLCNTPALQWECARPLGTPLHPTVLENVNLILNLIVVEDTIEPLHCCSWPGLFGFRR